MTRRPALLLAFAWLLLALVHLRPWRLSNGYVYLGDDRVYLAHLSTLVIDHDLDYSNEQVGSYALYPAGSSLLALPGYVAGYTADRLMHRADALRSSRDYSNTWTIVGYLVNQQVLVVMGLALLFWFLRTVLKVDNPSAIIATVLVMTSHLALYAFRRPMAHDGQFFVTALFTAWYFYALRRTPQTIAQVAAGAALAAAVMLVRWDNAPLAVLGALVFVCPGLRGEKVRVLPLGLYVLLCSVFFWIIQGPIWWGQFHSLWPYSSGHMAIVTGRLSQPTGWQNLRFLFHALWGADFGLLWTAPVIVLGLLASFPALRRLLADIRPPYRDPLIFVHVLLIFGVSFFQVMKWRTQASYYGYRYLMACLAPSAVFVAVALQSRRWLSAVAIVGIGVGVLTALPFEGNADTLTLTMDRNAYGGEGWMNNRYAVHAWTALGHPSTFGRALAAGPLGVPAGLFYAQAAPEDVPAFARPLRAKFSAFQTPSQRRYVGIATVLLLLPALLFWWPFGRVLNA